MSLFIKICAAVKEGEQNIIVRYFIGFGIAASGSWDKINFMRWQTLATMLVTLPLYFVVLGVTMGKGDFTWQSILLALLRNLYDISALFAMIAFAQKYRNRGGKVMKYLNQAAFPLYILHGIKVQFSAIVVLTILTSLGLFDICRRFAPTRILLGIKNHA